MRIVCVLAVAAVLALAAGRELPARMNTRAPELKGRDWLNVERGHEPTIESMRGQVAIIHFWTFECINCRHNLPVYARWQKRFAGQPVTLIGIHTPEFENEAVYGNVARRTRELGITYPVLLDPDLTNWRRWNQQFWPAVYLVDKHGRVRYRWEGELNYGNLQGETKMAALVDELVAEN